MATTLPEIIIFYIDLESKLIKPKRIFKTLENFIEEKKTKIPKSTFSSFFYKQGDIPFLSEETQDPKKLVEQLKTDWKLRETSKSFFENGLFYCLSFLAEKASKKAGNFRIIVLSDTPSNKSSEYAEALMGLVETVRNFPTFIDIIRIGESDLYPDDVKLRIISTITSGGLFYAKDYKEFHSTFIGLAKNKTLPDLREEGGQVIDEDKKRYYENIAKKLEPITGGSDAVCGICNQRTCKYCEDPKDLVKCVACGQIYHSCCAGLYSWKENIGLKHIFRCIECQSLIRLEEDFVYEVNGEVPPSFKDDMTKEELEASTKQEETWVPTDTEEKQEKQPSKEETPVEKSDTKKVKREPVRMGLFGPIRGANNNKPTEKEATPQKEPKETAPKPATSQQEPKKASSLLSRRRAGRSSRGNRNGSRICPICSTTIKPGMTKCPNCGSPIN